MADETVRIIRIETGGSEQTVKGLKDEINSLRDALLNTEKGTDEYKQVLEQLIADQQKLAEVMNAGKSQVSAATGSYNALVNQMNALKKVWRETTDEASRKDLGNQIKGINDKLKGMDESIGDYRRNVGNYTQSITAAFGSMGGAAKNMVGPLNSVKTAFSALSAHPIVGVITLLAGLLINGIAKGFKSSEENTNKLKVAFSGFKAIGDAVLKLFQGFAGWIAKVAEAAVNFADKLGLITPKMKERQEMMKKQIALEKQERDNIVKNAQLETEAAELRAKASDEENYTIEQRIKFLQEAQAKEQEQLELEKAILEQKAAQLEAQLALTESSGEELTKLNELKAQVIQVNAKIAQSQRSTNKEITALRRRGLSEAQQANQARLSLEKDLIQQELNLTEEGSDEQLRLAKELRKKELEIQQEGFKTKIKNRKDYEQAIKLSTQAYNADIMKLEREHARKEAEARMDAYSYTLLKGLREGSKEYYTALGDIARENLKEQQKLGKQDGESDAQFKQRIESLKKQVRDYYDQGIQAAERETEIVNQIILNGTRPMYHYYAVQYRQLKDYYDNMQKLQGESNEEFQARQNAAWKAALDALVNFHNEAIDGASKAIEDDKTLWFLKAGTLKNLEFEAQQFGKILNLSMETIRIIVDEDMTNITSGLMEHADEFKKHFYGMLPTPENIRELMNGSESEFKNLIAFMSVKGLIPDEIHDKYIESLRNVANAEKAVLEERYDNWNNLTSGIVSLTDNIADAYEADLKYAVEHNQKSEEVAKDEFETVKKLRISAAIVDTIQGAIAAFMGWQDKGQPWGAIIGATQAAATLAAGWAQIRQIQSTKFGATGSGGGSTMMAQAQVVPVVSDFTPQQMGLVTGQNEVEDLANAITSKPIKAFVVESEVSAAQELAAQRKNESTF